MDHGDARFSERRTFNITNDVLGKDDVSDFIAKISIRSMVYCKLNYIVK